MKKDSLLTEPNYVISIGYRLVRKYVGTCIRIGFLLLLGIMTSQQAYGQLTQLGLDIDGEAANDYSGYSVSLSSDGSHLAIGAPYNDGTANSAGHVRVYEWDGTAWS